MRAKKLKGRADARKPSPARSPAKSPGISTRTRGAAGRSAEAGGGNRPGGSIGGGGSSGAAAGNVTTYSQDQKILVVGDGDFSFSQGLVRHLKGRGSGLTLTSYDSAQQVLGKYKTAKSNIEKVKAAGATVLHGVDGTNLKKSFSVDGGKFDRIIFNFPHSGSQVQSLTM